MNAADSKPNNGGEPTAGFATVPIWLVLLSGLILLAGQLYLAFGAAGDFDYRVNPPFHDWDEVVAFNPVSPEQEMYNLGKLKFHQTCAACHQDNGIGQDGKAPPLVGSEWVLAAGPNRIEHAVMKGLTGQITVKGQQWNLTMPAWQDNFSDKELAAILTYVRNEWGNKAPPVKDADVKKVRGESHPGPMNGESELKQLSEQP